MANTPLVTCRSVLFDVKTTYFYYFLYLLLIIFILFLYCFSCIAFIIIIIFVIILVFCQVPRGFRVVPARFRVAPARFRVDSMAVLGGSGRFRQVPVGSGWVPPFTSTYTPIGTLYMFSIS